MRKATAFRGGANKTAPPCETRTGNKHLVTVPGEQLQRESLTEKPALRKNGLQHPAKGGSTPAFACQHAAIAPLPCPNLQLISQKTIKLRIRQFQKMQLQQEKQTAKSNLLRKCGLLAHTSAAFLKNCCTEKLFHSPAARFLQAISIFIFVSRETILMLLFCFPVCCNLHSQCGNRNSNRGIRVKLGSFC